MRRRELLGTIVAGAGTALLAGCSSGGDGSAGDTPTPTPSATATPTPADTPTTPTPTSTPLAAADGFQLLATHVPDDIAPGQQFTWGFTVRNTAGSDRQFSTEVELTLPNGMTRNIGLIEFPVEAGSTHRFSSDPISFDEPTTLVIRLLKFDVELTIEVGG